MCHRETRMLVAALACVAGMACQPVSSEPVWTGRVTDSAGIRIVVNPAEGLWGTTGSPRSSVIFRSRSTDSLTQLTTDVVSVARRPDGVVFALDRREQRVHVFAPDGAWMRTMGRPGRGPGELSDGVDALWLGHDDTVMVVDIDLQRVTRFTADGTPAGSFAVPMAGGIAYEWRADTAGRVVHALVLWGKGGASAEVVVARNRSGVVQDTLFALPFHEAVAMGGGGPVLTIFAPEAMWDVGPDGSLVSAVSDRYTIRRHAPDGRVLVEFSYPDQDHALTAADHDVYREALLRLWQSRMPPRFHAALRQNARFHASYPKFAALRAGPDGTTWVQRFRRASDISDAERPGLDAERDLGGPLWDVFDALGRYLGPVELPRRFHPLLFVGREIYGVQRDSLDVQSIMGVRLSEFVLPN